MGGDSFVKCILQSRFSQDEHSPMLVVFISVSSNPCTRKAKEFVEWDRLISQYIWQGKRARIKYRTLQLKKEQGGLDLPNLQGYYLAAQLRLLICLCSPSYNAGWKDIEGSSVDGIPLMFVLLDKEVQDELMIPQDSKLSTMLDSWKKTAKICQLGNQMKILRWCAFDS